MLWLKRFGLSRNAAFAMAQSIVTLVAVLISYRILVYYHGEKQLGLWAFISGITAFSRILDVSGGSSLPRFVALATRDKNVKLSIEFIDTVTISLFALYALIVAAMWWPLNWLIQTSVEPAFAPLGSVILPFVLGMMVLMVISTSMAGALDGLMRADLRAKAIISGFILQVILGLILIPTYGLVGMTSAQIIQFLWLYAVCRFLLKRKIQGIGWFPRFWTKNCFKQTLQYGLKIQATNLASSFIEPVIRFLMNSFGGLTFVAFYDVANKVIIQSRALVVSAISPSVPTFAANEHKAAEDKNTIIAATNRLTATIATLLLPAVGLAAPIVGHFLLGRSDSQYLILCAVLITGQFLAIFTLVQYFYAQALAQMRWNITGLIVTAVVTGPASMLLGNIYGGIGVAIGAVTAAVIGAMIGFVLNVKTVGTKSFAAALPSKLYFIALVSSYAFSMTAVFVVGAFVENLPVI